VAEISVMILLFWCRDSQSQYNFTHTHLMALFTWVSRYQKGKANLDFTKARDSEQQWYQLDHMQVCTLLQTDNHASTPPLSFLQAGCPSCHPINSSQSTEGACARARAHTHTHTHTHTQPFNGLLSVTEH